MPRLAGRAGMLNEGHAGAFRCILVQTVGAVDGLALDLSGLPGA